MVGQRARDAQAGNPVQDDKAFRLGFQQDASERDLMNLRRNMWSTDQRTRDAAREAYQFYQSNSGAAQSEFGPQSGYFDSTQRLDEQSMQEEMKRRWQIGANESIASRVAGNALTKEGYGSNERIATTAAAPGVAQAGAAQTNADTAAWTAQHGGQNMLQTAIAKRIDRPEAQPGMQGVGDATVKQAVPGYQTQEDIEKKQYLQRKWQAELADLKSRTSSRDTATDQGQQELALKQGSFTVAKQKLNNAGLQIEPIAAEAEARLEEESGVDKADLWSGVGEGMVRDRIDRLARHIMHNTPNVQLTMEEARAIANGYVTTSGVKPE